MNVSITHVAEGKTNVTTIMPRIKRCPGNSMLAKIVGDLKITIGIKELKIAKSSSGKKVVKIIVLDKSVAFGNTDVDETGNCETTKKKIFKIRDETDDNNIGNAIVTVNYHEDVFQKYPPTNKGDFAVLIKTDNIIHPKHRSANFINIMVAGNKLILIYSAPELSEIEVFIL